MEKPLNISEQSYLLMALLFARHSLFDLLEFLPEKKQIRLVKAAEKMLLLPRPERIRTAIQELKRLFFLDEYLYVKIHPSWLKEALKKEPPYLKSYLRNSGLEGKAPTTIAHHYFIDSLIETPLRVPLFEPPLIKLQQQVSIDQHSLFQSIGQKMVHLLTPYFVFQRWRNFVSRRGILLPKTAQESALPHPFENATIRSFCITFAAHRPSALFLPSLFIALIALYLKTKKDAWKNTIKLSLDVQFGELLEEALKELDTVSLSPEMINLAASFITEEI